ncbi:ABC transporter ATP-binding protein [Thiomonas intermedia]|uniref:ABC transporter ATP-binding protein n=1 Tax=Thiomonas intermedia TaxID=926 RepID=UPI0012AB3E10
MPPGGRALEIEALHAGYGRVQVLRGVHLQVRAGELLLLLGRNGSGRSTLLKALMGLIPATGSARLDGRELLVLPAHRRARLGLGYVPEQREIFPRLSVRQNLLLGANPARTDPGASRWNAATVQRLFPALTPRLGVSAQALSGGEQQMLALARALMGNPDLLLLDEPTEGLAPQRVAETADLAARLRSLGLGLLMVEQKPWARALADRVVVLGDGRVQFEGPPRDLPQDVSAAWL